MKKTKVAKAKIKLQTETVRALAASKLSSVAGGLYTSPSNTTNKCQICAASDNS